MRHRQT
ncbi:hypothetical protein D027_4703A, partial [Vibrio parahaemolyticus 861]